MEQNLKKIEIEQEARQYYFDTVAKNHGVVAESDHLEPSEGTTQNHHVRIYKTANSGHRCAPQRQRT